MSAAKTAPGEGCCAFRPDIEGLRAIAILAVVIYHAGIPGFAGGFVGVDVFFVLSGFLITGILVRELTQTGTVHLGRFWARRMRRLLPAAFLVLAATGLASAIWLPPAERGAAAQGIAASTLYGANWVFATQALDYLAADHALSPTLHFWSLAVEEQFYMVWPLLLLAVTWRARQDPARMVRRLLVAMVAICLISFAFSVLLTRAAQPMAFFASPPRFWQLGVGALLAIGWAGVARLPATAREVLAAGGLLLVAASISLMPLVLAAGHTWPGVLALGPTLGTALLVAAGSETRVGRLLAIRPLAFIGQLSYGWYLWHWGVLVFWDHAVGPASMPQKGLLLLGALGIAWLSLRFVENPVRFHPPAGTHAACAAAGGWADAGRPGGGVGGVAARRGVHRARAGGAGAHCLPADGLGGPARGAAAGGGRLPAALG
jgi:peptidoglycan/LPS O-acetylase OafA/YrhL